MQALEWARMISPLETWFRQAKGNTSWRDVGSGIRRYSQCQAWDALMIRASDCGR